MAFKDCFVRIEDKKEYKEGINWFCCEETLKELNEGLSLHLTGKFYPPLPSEVKETFLKSFNKYWEGKVNQKGLKHLLSEVYQGSLYDYGFYVFLMNEGGDI